MIRRLAVAAFSLACWPFNYLIERWEARLNGDNE